MTSSPASLLAALERLASPHVLVLGDLILDRYTFGDAERVSQEAPVILLRADRREARLGGAANVVNMLRGLDARVTCAGIVGADSDGQLVRQLLADAGADAKLVLEDPARPTTVKERFIGRAQGRHPHQMLRVDSEVRDPLSADLEERLAARMIAALDGHDVVLISDYDKGVCTPGLLDRVIAAARARSLLVVVDPIRLPVAGPAGYVRYAGATTMTPNRIEAELASGVRIVTPADALRAGQRLCETADLEFAIITLDRDGMALIERDPAERSNFRGSLHPTRARAVYDITGAGDMVLSMVGLALASGLSPAEAVGLGNVAGGLEVERVGVAIVTRDEIRQELTHLLAEQAPQPAAIGGPVAPSDKVLSLSEATALAEQWKSQGRKVVFTNGCFDLLHVGHATYLQQARALGDALFVGLNSDESVRRLKGPLRPVIAEHDRALLLASLAAVDGVIVFDEPTPHTLLTQLRPDVLVKGGSTQEIVGREVVEAYGGRVVRASLVEGVSTSAIVQRLQESVPMPHFLRTEDGEPPRGAVTQLAPGREPRAEDLAA